MQSSFVVSFLQRCWHGWHFAAQMMIFPVEQNNNYSNCAAVNCWRCHQREAARLYLTRCWCALSRNEKADQENVTSFRVNVAPSLKGVFLLTQKNPFHLRFPLSGTLSPHLSYSSTREYQCCCVSGVQQSFAAGISSYRRALAAYLINTSLLKNP